MTTSEGITHASSSSHGGEEAHHDHHVCGTGTFVVILLALLFLTFVTVAVSRFDFGGANMWIAMAVASFKASLVMAVFMHMLWDTAVNKLFFISSFLFLGILFLFQFADLFARSQLEAKHGRAAPLDYTQMPEQSVPGSSEEKFHKQFKQQ